MLVQVIETRCGERTEGQQHRRAEGEVLPTGPLGQSLQEALPGSPSLECVPARAERRVGDRGDAFGMQDLADRVQCLIELYVRQRWHDPVDHGARRFA